MFEALSRPAIAITVGVILAVAMVLFARRLGAREMVIYGVGLCVAAVIYVLFGLLRGAPAAHLGLQFSGVLVFGAAGVLGMRRWPALLALGWTAHALWDLFLHYDTGPAFAPAWYAMFCVGFDLFVGGYIAGRIPAAPPVRTG